MKIDEKKETTKRGCQKGKGEGSRRDLIYINNDKDEKCVCT